MPQFLEQYGTEQTCRDSLFKLRCPEGFRCPDCGNSNYCELSVRKVYQCHRCHDQTSLTASTLFEKTQLPLKTWFLAIFLFTQSKSGLSALALARHLGVSYKNAWMVKHKLMQAMREGDDGKPLIGSVQVDDAFWGGESRGGRQDAACRRLSSLQHQPPAVGDAHDAAERLSQQLRGPLGATTPLAGCGTNPRRGPLLSAIVETCPHWSIVTGGADSMQTREFTWINTMFGNVNNNAIFGTYHSIHGKHLERSLAEFAYRFNRRFELDRMIERLAHVACRTAPLPHRLAKLAEIHT